MSISHIFGHFGLQIASERGWESIIHLLTYIPFPLLSRCMFDCLGRVIFRLYGHYRTSFFGYKVIWHFTFMVISGIWSILAGQNRGSYIRNPVYLHITTMACTVLVPHYGESICIRHNIFLERKWKLFLRIYAVHPTDCPSFRSAC